MTQNPYDQMTEVILAALDLTMSRYYLERNPGDPGAEPSVELAEENLFEKCKILVEEQPEEQHQREIAKLKEQLTSAQKSEGFRTYEQERETEDLMADGKKIGEVKVPIPFDEEKANRALGFPPGWKRLSERYPIVPQFPYGEEPHFRTEHYMSQEVPLQKNYPMPNVIGGVPVPPNTPLADQTWTPGDLKKITFVDDGDNAFAGEVKPYQKADETWD